MCCRPAPGLTASSSQTACAHAGRQDRDRVSGPEMAVPERHIRQALIAWALTAAKERGPPHQNTRACPAVTTQQNVSPPTHALLSRYAHHPPELHHSSVASCLSTGCVAAALLWSNCCAKLDCHLSQLSCIASHRRAYISGRTKCMAANNPRRSPRMHEGCIQMGPEVRRSMRSQLAMYHSSEAVRMRACMD